MSKNRHEVIQAAGGLVWRKTARSPQVLLVHRPRYDDWSFPKGKMEPGESWTETALREVVEETGIRVTLDDYAGSLSYMVRQRVKIVLYWNMRVRKEPAFVPNEEVDQVKWLAARGAMSKLTYEFEKKLLRDVVAVKWPS